jgi:hypothetical protein
VALLEKHAESYRAQIRAVKNGSKEQYDLFGALQRIEKSHAYSLLEQGPKELKKAFRNVAKLYLLFLAVVVAFHEPGTIAWD